MYLWSCGTPNPILPSLNDESGLDDSLLYPVDKAAKKSAPWAKNWRAKIRQEPKFR
jgi:hypothetical protein